MTVKKRIYSRGERMVHPHNMPCMFCRKPTTRRTGILLHPVCSSCAVKYGVGSAVVKNNVLYARNR